ncbi:MAG: ABC transporter substrate-binding protein [Actinomycetota bacterium]|jgi:branched-chain amino acid transport system substrate-binding protein|nr:ABC transporter substrate-binding protein [Actinomycetota bacterium]
MSSAPTTRRRGALIAVLMATIGAVSCDGSSSVGPDLTVSAPSTTIGPSRIDDGVLRLAVHLPTTGAGARLGVPMSDGVRVAVSAINAAGGVLGEPVEVDFFDEATSVDLRSTIQSGADAVIGPASSTKALAVLDQAVDAEVLVCSPSATAISLDRFPDSNLFFRTVASDTLQMSALARTAARTGSGSITIVHLDDLYGRDLADALQTAVGARASLSVSSMVPFSGDDPDLADDAALAIETGARIIAVLGDADDGGRMLTAIDAVLAADPDGVTPFVVVNDSLRAATDVMAALSPRLRSVIVGVAPRAVVAAVDSPTGVFATNAFDCAILVALAALQSGSDAPRAIADQMASVSAGGRICTTFAECADLLEQGLQIDYNGLSGNVDLSSTGDLNRGWFREFRFDETGREYIFNEIGFEAP